MPRLILLIILFATPTFVLAGPPTDRQGDPLPAGAVARFGSARLVHGPEVKSLCFSADGKTLMSHDDREVRLWDLATGQLLQRVSRRQLGFPLLLLSGESALYYSGQSKCLALRDLRTGKLQNWAVKREGWVLRLASSPTGRLVAFVLPSGEVDVFGGSDGKRIARLGGADLSPHARLVFSPNGSLLLGVGERKVVMWDVGSQKLLANLELLDIKADVPITVAFSPDGQSLALSWNKTVRVYDSSAFKVRKEFRDPEVRCRDLAFTSDGKQLIGVTEEGPVLRWSVEGKLIQKIDLATEPCRACAFSTDGGSLAVVGESGQIRVIDLRKGREQPIPHRQAPLIQVRCTTSGQIITISEDGQVIFWTAKDGREVSRHRLPVLGAVTVSPDGQYAAWFDKEKALDLHEIASGKRMVRIETTSQKWAFAPKSHFAFSPDGRLLLTANGDGYRLWSTTRGTLLKNVEGNDAIPTPVAFASDGRTFFSGSGIEIKAFEVVTGRSRGEPYQFSLVSAIGSRTAVDLKCSQNGKTLLLIREIDDNDGSGVRLNLTVFSGADPEPLWQFDLNADDVVAISPNGRWLARTNRLGPIWSTRSNCVGVVCRILLHDLHSRTPHRTHAVPVGHESIVTALDFTPDGKHLVSASKDGTALVWDIERITASPKLPPEPDEKRLAKWWDHLGAANPEDAVGPMSGYELYPSLAIPFFKARLRPKEGPSPGHIETLIRSLDSQKFPIRQQATRELEKLRELPEPELEAVLDSKPTLEMATRIKNLLKKINEPIADTDRLRELRAIEVLERIGTTEARVLLEGLSRGHPGARLTREAKSSLERWPKR